MDDNIHTVEQALQLQDMLCLSLHYVDTDNDGNVLYDEYEISGTSAVMHILHDTDAFQVVYQDYMLVASGDRLECLDAYINEDYSVAIRDKEAALFTLDNIKYAIRTV